MKNNPIVNQTWQEKLEYLFQLNGNTGNAIGFKESITKLFNSELLLQRQNYIKEILERIKEEKDRGYEPKTILDGLIAELKTGLRRRE